jgi:hypothetical protein
MRFGYDQLLDIRHGSKFEAPDGRTVNASGLLALARLQYPVRDNLAGLREAAQLDHRVSGLLDPTRAVLTSVPIPLTAAKLARILRQPLARSLLRPLALNRCAARHRQIDDRITDRLNGKHWSLMRANGNRDSTFPQVTGIFGQLWQVLRCLGRQSTCNTSAFRSMNPMYAVPVGATS